MIRQRRQPQIPEEHAETKRRNRTAAVGGDVAQFGRAAFERAGFYDPVLVLRWREIVGAEIARYSQPLRLTHGSSGGVLTLKADPAAAVFLQHESRALCSRINTWLGKPSVQRLRFVPGEHAPPVRPPKTPKRRASASADPVHRFAGDEDLRAALLALANARFPGAGTTED